MRFTIRALGASAALALLLTVAGVGGASAQPPERQFLVGTGFLCDVDPAACPAISSNAVGDTIEITGAGLIDKADDRVEGAGSFVHRDSTGAVLGSGTWVAEELLGFQSYGNATPDSGLPANFEGGLARLRVRLLPASGGEALDATLWIDCLVGDPPEGGAEGIELEVEGGDVPIFDQEVQGFTIFIEQE